MKAFRGYNIEDMDRLQSIYTNRISGTDFLIQELMSIQRKYGYSMYPPTEKMVAITGIVSKEFICYRKWAGFYSTKLIKNKTLGLFPKLASLEKKNMQYPEFPSWQSKNLF